MDHRQENQLQLQKQHWSALEEEIAKKIYNTYFDAFSDLTQQKLVQREYGDQVFKFSRNYLVSNQEVVPEQVNADIMTAGGLKQYLLPYVESQIAEMFLEIDEECLKEALDISMTLDTVNVESLHVQGIDSSKPLIEQLNKFDKDGQEYKTLVHALVDQLVHDFDSFISNKIQEKRQKYLSEIPETAPELILKGYANGWTTERAKSGQYKNIQNKLEVDKDYFKKAKDANTDAREFFSEDLESHPLSWDEDEEAMDEWEFYDRTGMTNLMMMPDHVLNMAVPIEHLPGGEEKYGAYLRQNDLIGLQNLWVAQPFDVLSIGLPIE